LLSSATPRQDGPEPRLIDFQLGISLNIEDLCISRATETEMKAQLLLREVQVLFQVCQVLECRVKVHEYTFREKNKAYFSNADSVHKVRNLRDASTAVCTQMP